MEEIYTPDALSRLTGKDCHYLDHFIKAAHSYCQEKHPSMLVSFNGVDFWVTKQMDEAAIENMYRSLIGLPSIELEQKITTIVQENKLALCAPEHYMQIRQKMYLSEDGRATIDFAERWGKWMQACLEKETMSRAFAEKTAQESNFDLLPACYVSSARELLIDCWQEGLALGRAFEKKSVELICRREKAKRIKIISTIQRTYR